jgi:hypothetical protein
METGLTAPIGVPGAPFRLFADKILVLESFDVAQHLLPKTPRGFPKAQCH